MIVHDRIRLIAIKHEGRFRKRRRPSHFTLFDTGAADLNVFS
jgi:hypothetical protein